jgi:calcineurin-like phosphoesterase family protein
VNIFFTADWHINHANILKYAGRTLFMNDTELSIYNKLKDRPQEEQKQFKISKESLLKMNERLISNCNERVKEDDMLFFLGDLGFKSGTDRGEGEPEKLQKYIDQINCKHITWIEGNHDIKGKNSLKTPIQKIIIKHGGKKICLVHDPEFCDVNYEINLTAHCVTPDTEILTKEGWKKYNEIKIGKEVATYNMKKHRIEYQPLLNIIKYNYKGKLYHFSREGKIDILSTPNHRHVVFSRRTKSNHNPARIKLSYNINDSDLILLNTDKWNYPILYQFKSPAWAELIGFIIGDGYCEWNKNELKSINIHQKRGWRTYIYLPKLLKKCNLLYTIKGKRSKYPTFRISYVPEQNKEFITFITNNVANKKLNQLLISLPKKQLKGLFKGLIASDGHCYSSNFYQFYQKDYNNILFFEELCLRLGLSFATHKRKNSGFKPNEWYYYVNIRRNQKVQATSKKSKTINYDGLVWCPEVQNGTWVAKRNGTAFVTGNCHTKWQIKRYRKGMSFTDCINCGVDVWLYFPITWNEIYQRYSQWLKEQNG